MNRKAIVVNEVVGWILIVLGLVAMLIVLAFVYGKGQEYLKRLVSFISFGRVST